MYRSATAKLMEALAKQTANRTEPARLPDGPVQCDAPQLVWGAQPLCVQ